MNLTAELAAVRQQIRGLRIDMTRPNYPGWPLEHRHGTEAALDRLTRREAELADRLAADEARTTALADAAAASSYPLLYAIAYLAASTRTTRSEPAMLNPMIRWEPGTTVRYHGSLTALHGVYAAYPCTCLQCSDDGDGAVRFQLVDTTGHVTVTCVRARSITPT